MGIKGTADKGISNSVVQYPLHGCVYVYVHLVGYMHRLPYTTLTFESSAIIRSILEPGPRSTLTYSMCLCTCIGTKHRPRPHGHLHLSPFSPRSEGVEECGTLKMDDKDARAHI